MTDLAIHAHPAAGGSETEQTWSPAPLEHPVLDDWQLLDEVWVVDTSTLMADPGVLDVAHPVSLVLPLTVIDELDKNKSREDAPGSNARVVLRRISEHPLLPGTDISTPQPWGTGSLHVEVNGLALDQLRKFHLDPSVSDHKILAAALGLGERGYNVTVVSNDAAMRVKAGVLGLKAVEYATAPSTDSGWRNIETRTGLIDKVYEFGKLSLSEVSEPDREQLAVMPVNSFAVASAGSSSVLLRRTVDGVAALPRGERAQRTAWGLKARSKEQAFALELLTDDSVPLVALSGRAGTGKTIVALAAALQKVFEDGVYSRLSILRPVISVGRADLGFLPGELDEKLEPWFDAIVDAMVALSSTSQTHAECQAMLNEWVLRGQLTMEPVTFLRGRSLTSTFIIVDEVQNMEPGVVRTVVTRVGEGSKAVLLGDVNQIDNPWTSTHHNGLTAAISAFTGEPEFGHVQLTKGERSRLADLAATLMT